MQRKKLKVLRMENGFSQEKMALRLGLSRNHYQRIECGVQEVSLRFLVALTMAFGMSLEEAKELTARESEEKENDR